MTVAAPGRRRSIRWQVTLLATLIVSIVLAMTAVAVQVIASRQLYDNLDHVLEQRADQVEAALATPTVTFANSDAEDRFAQVFDGAGSVVFSTANVSAAAVVDAPSGTADDARTVDIALLGDDAFRVLVRPIAPVDGVARFVAVGEYVGDLQRELRTLAVALMIVFPVAVAALAAVVWWLVGRTLLPVERIRRQVATIGLDQIDQRVPLPGTGDEIDRLAGTMNEMLARLDAAVAAQRRFVADASHELRTPLTRLRTTLEVELTQPVDRADPTATCESALGDVVGMQGLVDDLLFLAHSDAGGGGAQHTPVDLDVVVDDEVRSARQATVGGPVIVMSGVSAAAVDGDRAQLSRLVRNLLANAVRHATQTVVVTLTEQSGSVVLAIEDDGPGIPAADRARVFERFVRLDAARSAGEGGAGLGLAIAAGIAAAHGATIAVTEAPRRGARFEVRFPARAGSEGVGLES